MGNKSVEIPARVIFVFFTEGVDRQNSGMLLSTCYQNTLCQA